MENFSTKVITEAGIPLVVEPVDKKLPLSHLLAQLAEERPFFKKQLLKSGALLFRGFPVENADDFAELIRQVCPAPFVHYIGGDSPRTIVKGDVYTSTEAPPWLKIPLHNELSFIKNYPKHIHFYCQIAPQERGETIIADARKVYASVDEGVKKLFVERGLRYVSCYYGKSRLMDLLNRWQRAHKPWRDVFETLSKEEVERKCRESGFEFQWNVQDWLQISQVRPAVIAHPETKEMVWFNQAHLFDFNPRLLGWWRYIAAKLFYVRKHTRLHEVFFADHTPIPRQALYHVMDTLDANTVYFPWQKGDVLVLDNVLCMHGRSPFHGPRRVLTAMTG
jgi:alpha-ketoglutarate-dependent taurine dioxygenase